MTAEKDKGRSEEAHTKDKGEGLGKPIEPKTVTSDDVGKQTATKASQKGK